MRIKKKKYFFRKLILYSDLVYITKNISGYVTFFNKYLAKTEVGTDNL